MLTASIVIYKTQKEEFRKIVECSLKSSIHTIFIVDNSPSNKLQEVVASYRSSRLIYIWGQGNIGYGAGHNIAINKSFESDANYHIIPKSRRNFSARSNRIVISVYGKTFRSRCRNA